jgi:hypothetical protein
MMTRRPLRTLIALTLTALCTALAVAAAPGDAAACGPYMSEEEWTEIEMRGALALGDRPVRFDDVVHDGDRIHALVHIGRARSASVMGVTFERNADGALVVIDRTYRIPADMAHLLAGWSSR